MNKIVFTTISLAALMASCVSKEKLEEAQSENTELTNELQQTLATQDSLFALINDITAGMNQIKDLEHIISSPSMGETPSRKEELRNDMIAIQQALQERRERLAQLEDRLKKSNSENSTLKKTIDNLRKQISEQESEIASLHSQVDQANAIIEKLGDQVSSLNATVTDVTAQREEARREATQLTDELNVCYYAIGSKKELQETQLIKTGFLRKTKILPEDFDKTYFIKGDRRTLLSIPLHSNKAEIMTNQPASSYQIVTEDGQKVLKITDPERFWEQSPFLIVKID